MKCLATIFLALILALGPTSAFAYSEAHQICVKTEIINGEPVCVKTGLKEIDKQTVEPPVPAPSVSVPPIKLPDVRVPDVQLPSVNTSGRNNSQSGGSTSNRGAPGKVVVRSTPTVLPNGTVESKERVVIEKPEAIDPNILVLPEPPAKNVKVAGKPWYLWTTLVFVGIAIGFMLFYDTDKPKPDKKRHRKSRRERKNLLE